ncbi:hypothetical protein PSAR109036_01980 [Psychrobacter arenosus]|uniref:hypothetical protein n=1 Tax=Psychrobacter arenosus TaxID=256326 RepID=UPI001917E88E|nr:hypothetical protein [Psychrobacter arenosus]
MRQNTSSTIFLEDARIFYKSNGLHITIGVFALGSIGIYDEGIQCHFCHSYDSEAYFELFSRRSKRELCNMDRELIDLVVNTNDVSAILNKAYSLLPKLEAKAVLPIKAEEKPAPIQFELFGEIAWT